MGVLSDDDARLAADAYVRNGRVASKAARELGLASTTFQKRLDAAKRRGMVPHADPAIAEAVAAGGIGDSRNLSHFWKIVKDNDGNGFSLFIKNPETKEQHSLQDIVRDSIAEAIADGLPEYEPRPPPVGEHLLTIDLADVHFLKLCVKTETGYEYNRQVARHRVIEGTKALLTLAEPHGVGRILFVLGNDILHVDGVKPETTSGTPQHTDGSIFQGFKDAQRALVDAIEVAAEVAPVDLVHCMSNHDRFTGWALSQTVAALLSKHPNVRATPYNISERHRKYYRFGQNLIGVTHGDGAKEEKLYGLMVKEARDHISECQNLYWLLHHVHHKDRKTRDGDVAYLREKDHNGMSAIMSGRQREEGGDVNIEYVRSPSAPDSWHDINGYVNRQGVECFLFHPTLGQRARYTDWF